MVEDIQSWTEQDPRGPCFESQEPKMVMFQNRGWVDAS